MSSRPPTLDDTLYVVSDKPFRPNRMVALSSVDESFNGTVTEGTRYFKPADKPIDQSEVNLADFPCSDLHNDNSSGATANTLDRSSINFVLRKNPNPDQSVDPAQQQLQLVSTSTKAVVCNFVLPVKRCNNWTVTFPDSSVPAVTIGDVHSGLSRNNPNWSIGSNQMFTVGGVRMFWHSSDSPSFKTINLWKFIEPVPGRAGSVVRVGHLKTRAYNGFDERLSTTMDSRLRANLIFDQGEDMMEIPPGALAFRLPKHFGESEIAVVVLAAFKMRVLNRHMIDMVFRRVGLCDDCAATVKEHRLFEPSNPDRVNQPVEPVVYVPPKCPQAGCGPRSIVRRVMGYLVAFCSRS